jgi:hypothetical protein
VKKTSVKSIGIIALFFLVSCLYGGIGLRTKIEYERATLEELTALNADKPFQYRILLPITARGIKYITPFVPLKALYLMFDIASCFFLLLAFRYYLLLFCPAEMATVGAMLILYPIFWNYDILGNLYYPSDIPAILFYTLGLIFIYKRNHSLFYLVFFVSTWNRETSCFLTPVFLLHSLDKMKVPALCSHLLFQVFIWLSIKLGLHFWFLANEGAILYENQWVWNINILIHPLKYWYNIIRFVLAFGLLWIFIPFGFKDHPKFFKQTLLVIFPFYIMHLLAGVLDEVRTLSELVPIVTAPAFFGLKKLIMTEEIDN